MVETFILGKASDVTEIQKLYWFTYRTNFPKLAKSDLTNDIGWGCTFRNTQSMLANVIKNKYSIEQIKELFLDKPSLSNPFSIHNMLIHGKCFDKQLGEQYGPNATCIMIQKCNEFANIDLNIYIAKDSTIYKDQVKSNTLILIPIRLGLEEISEEHREQLLNLLEFSCSKGIIGGKGKSSYYYVGKKEKTLYYLDPHTIQKFDDYVLHCDKVNSMDITEIDPSMALCFYCEKEEDLDNFYELSKSIELYKIEENEKEYVVSNKEDDDFIVI